MSISQTCTTFHTDESRWVRRIVVDWMIEIRFYYESVSDETLSIAIHLMDTYLDGNTVERRYLQLIAATCLLIAGKYEEIYPLLLKDYMYLAGPALYTIVQFLEMERSVLTAVEFSVSVDTPVHIFHAFNDIIATYDTPTLSDDSSFSVYTLGRYMLFHCIHADIMHDYTLFVVAVVYVSHDVFKTGKDVLQACKQCQLVLPYITRVFELMKTRKQTDNATMAFSTGAHGNIATCKQLHDYLSATQILPIINTLN